MTKSSEGGFTLLEVLITSVVIVPILFAVISTKDVVSNTISSNERRADAGDQVRRVARRLRQLLRPTLVSSLGVRANQADIDAATAAEALRQIEDPGDPPIYIPAMNEWIPPSELDPRPNIQFRSAVSFPAVNAAALTAPRAMEFRIDSNETDNDIDDDGDGIVDEGKLYFTYGANSFVLLNNVEFCTFTVESSVVLLNLQVARVDNTGRIHRASIQQRIFLRNN